MSGDKLESLPDFMGQVVRKMRQGQREFGDTAFDPNSKSHLSLVREIQEELIDICGWSYILYHRLEQVKVTFSQRVWKEILEDIDAADGTD